MNASSTPAADTSGVPSTPAATPSSALAAPFVEGLARHELRFQRCGACGAAQSLARHACTRCGGEALAWETARGTATLHAVTVVARAPSDGAQPAAGSVRAKRTSVRPSCTKKPAVTRSPMRSPA
ncbi:MAG: hypothetical protein EOP73_26075, partial [Variovorax sp.]